MDRLKVSTITPSEQQCGHEEEEVDLPGTVRLPNIAFRASMAHMSHVVIVWFIWTPICLSHLFVKSVKASVIEHLNF